MAKALILASGSRFRKKMLEDAGVNIRVVPADVDETAVKIAMTEDNPEVDAADVAEVLARAKAEQVSLLNPDALVIGADQILVCDGEIYSKPPTSVAARQQLLALRGRSHTLATAVVLAVGGETVWSLVDEPRLTMRSFSHSFLEAYLVAAGDAVCETVGGYALEGLGGQLFESLEGNYFSIIGLPLLPLLAELRQRGVLAV
jgi:septum formation protein